MEKTATARKQKSLKEGDVVSLAVGIEDAPIFDEIDPKKSQDTFPDAGVGTVIELKTFAKVIVGTKVGWVDANSIVRT